MNGATGETLGQVKKPARGTREGCRDSATRVA
jgi:hypothetical protein